MSCSIIRNGDNEIIKVYKPGTEQESRVYKKLASLPHVETLDQAANIYNGVLKAGAEDFTLEVGGETFENFKDALNSTSEPFISIVANGKVVAKIPATRDERLTAGVINAFIADEVIEGEKVTHKGETFYQATGKTFERKKLTTEFFKDSIKGVVSRSDHKVKDGLITINKSKITPLKEESIGAKITDLLGDYFSADTVIARKGKINEKNLKLNLLNILTDLGISVTTIKRHQERFKREHKVPPSASAISDVLNRVIAFKDGKITLEDLTEETMHLVVETMEQEEIDSLRDFVLESREYKDNYDEYNEEYKGDQKLLEKEILGKILKNITLDRVKDKPQDFVSKLYEVIKNFFNSLAVTPSHREQLARLNNLVEEVVIKQKEVRFTESSLDNSKEVALLYSLSDKASDTQITLKKLFKGATESKQFAPYIRELSEDKNFENLEGQQLLLTVMSELEMSTKLVETTEAALATAEKTGKALAPQNFAILNDLVKYLQGDLQRLAKELETPPENIGREEANSLKSKLLEVSSRITAIEIDSSKMTDNHVRGISDRVLTPYNEAERELFKEQVEKVIAGDVEDVNKVFSYFGQLHHASNPVLNLVSRVLQESKLKSNINHKEDVAELLNHMEEAGVSQEDLNALMENGYLRGLVKQKEFEADLDNLKLEAFNEVAGTNIKTFEEYETLRLERELDENGETKKLKELTVEEAGRFVSLTSEKQSVIEEKPMTPAYYEEKFARYEDKDTTFFKRDKNGAKEYDSAGKPIKITIKGLNITGATQAYLNSGSAMRSAVMQKASVEEVITENGKQVKKTRIVLTPKDLADLNSISKIRKAKKDIYSVTSKLKKGFAPLTLNKPSEGVEGVAYVKLKTGQYLTLINQEEFDKLSQVEKDTANISFDLHKIDAERARQVAEDRLEAKEGTSEQDARKKVGVSNLIRYIKNNTRNSKELKELLIANIGLSLSQEFYESMDGDSFLNGDTLDKLNPTKLDKVALVKEAYAQRTALLSKHRNTTSPLEVDRLTETEQKKIKSLSFDIAGLNKELTLPQREEAEKSEGVKSTNAAYAQELEVKKIKSGTKEELRFIEVENHADLSKLSALTDAYNRSTSGITLTPTEAKLLQSHKKGTLLATQLSYARDRLYPYYTRYAPENYRTISERLDSGESIDFVLTNTDLNKGAIGVLNDPYLDIRIDKSFEEEGGDSNNYVNPKYKLNYEGGRRQPKEGTYVDHEFINKFGINSMGEATREVDLYKAYKLYIKLINKGLEHYGEEGRTPLKAVQVSATTTEKFTKIGKMLTKGQGKGAIGVIKALMDDTFSYRIDDIAFGEKGFENSRELPKYYLRDLEEKSDVSTDLISSAVLFSARANEYKAKKDALADVNALQNVLLRSKGQSRNKELTNTIAMAQSAIDGAIFGKVESKPFEVKVPGLNSPLDVTKIMRVLTKFSTLRNLGYSAVSPITGLLSGTVQKQVEQFLGEKLNNEAAGMATAEYNNVLAVEGAKNALKYNDNSKLFLIGQTFGVWDLSTKARNAKFNFVSKIIGKSAMGAFQISDYPIKPKIVLGILFDNRIVGGKVQTMLDYVNEGTRNGKTKKEMEDSWALLKKEAVYEHMDFTKEGFKWKDDIRQKLLAEYKLKDKAEGIEENTPNQKKRVQEYLDLTLARIQMNITEQVSNIDGQINPNLKTLAQRDALLSTTLQHRGFLAILAENKLKDKQFNFATGLYEEGSWRTVGKEMGIFFNTEGNFGDKLTALRKSTQKREGESDIDYELRIRNLKRVMVEMTSYLALTMLLTTAMVMMDDDEDDGWFESVANLFAVRLMNESASNLSFNMITDVGGIVESPVVLYKNALKLMPIWNAANFSEIEQGRYKGITKSQQYFMNTVPGYKNMYDMLTAEDIQQTTSTYKKYNQGIMTSISSAGIIPFADSLMEKEE